MSRVLSLVVGGKERLKSEGKNPAKVRSQPFWFRSGFFFKCRLVGAQATKETGRTKCHAMEERGDTPFSFWKVGDTRNRAHLGAFKNDSTLCGWSGS